jgi:hypothetical protein
LEQQLPRPGPHRSRAPLRRRGPNGHRARGAGARDRAQRRPEDALRGEAAADRRQLPEFDRSTGISPAVFSLLRAFTAALALELSPVRLNLIEAAFVDTALAASFFNGDEAALEAAESTPTATWIRLPSPMCPWWGHDT